MSRPESTIFGMQVHHYLTSLILHRRQNRCPGARFHPPFQRRPEADGYLIVFLNHVDTMISSLAILDTRDLSAGPIARIKLPFRLRSGVHGSWVMVFTVLLILRFPSHRCQMGGK